MSLDKRNLMIGANLSYYRTKLHLSYRELATLTDIPHTTLAAIERGKMTITSELLERVADALGITKEDLVQENIMGTVEFLVRFLQETNVMLIAPIMFWMSKSVDGPLKERALKVALEFVDEKDILHHLICFDLADYYEGIDQAQSLKFYKKAATYGIKTVVGLYNG